MTPEQKRLKRLRREMLGYIDRSKANGPIRGRMVADLLEESSDRIEGDEEVIRIAIDLEHLGLITVKDTRTLKAQRPGLDHTNYTITAKGTALLAGLAPVEALIDDDRIDPAN